MAITVESTLEKLNNLRAFLKTLQPNMSISNDTDIGSVLQSIAEALHGLDINTQAVEDDIYPSTASTAALDLHAETRLGTNARKSATISSGSSALRVTGTAGSSVAVGDTLAHSDGTRYQISEAGTIAVGATTVDVDVESISTGIACNKAIAEILTLETPPAGIESDTSIVIALTGGTDQESDDELRVRLLDAFRNPPAGGRASDYKSWAESITGINAAYIYCPSSSDPAGRQGMGTVDVVVTKTGTGAARIPAAATITLVDDYIDTLRPCTTKSVSVFGPTAQSQAVDVQITASDDYDFDWSNTMTVSSWSAPTLTLTTTPQATIQTAIDANSSARIWVNGEMLTATAYSTTPDTLTISETPTNTPSGTIYPAGPISEEIYDAIVDLIDSLGPSRLDSPASGQDWDDTLRLAKLYDVIMDVVGVEDSTVVTPATNIQPTDSGTTVVNFLTAGTVTIRPA